MDVKVKKKLLLAVLFSAFFMAFLLLKADLSHFQSIARRIDWRDFIAAFILYFLANFIRSVRFHQIDHKDNTLIHWWIINHIYSFITATLPGGAGEAATAYMLKRFSSFNIVSALRLLLLTRLMDLTMYAALLFAAALMIGSTAPYREAALWVSGILFIVSLVVSYPRSERGLIEWVRRLPFKGSIMERLRQRLEDVARISEEKHSRAFFFITMIQTALMVLCVALGVHFMLRSFGTGFVPVQSFYCLSVYTLFQMVPVQGIAGIGTQAAWWTLGLTVAGYSAPDAVAMGIMLHATFYAIIVVLGFFALLAGVAVNRPN